MNSELKQLIVIPWLVFAALIATPIIIVLLGTEIKLYFDNRKNKK